MRTFASSTGARRFLFILTRCVVYSTQQGWKKNQFFILTTYRVLYSHAIGVLCHLPVSEPSVPPIDSILRLMTVWRITEKILRTAVIISIIISSSYNFSFRLFFCVLCFIKVKFFISLLCVCAILPAKAIPEMAGR